MKFGLFKSTQPAPLANRRPPGHSRRINSFASNLYDDPAFSSDPHAHPLFVSSADSAWVTPPAPGHPRLRAQRRQGLSPSYYPDQNAPVDLEEMYPPQPPNTPMPADAPAERQRVYYVTNGPPIRLEDSPPLEVYDLAPETLPPPGPYLRKTQRGNNAPINLSSQNEKAGGIASLFRRMKIATAENRQGMRNDSSPPPYDYVTSTSALSSSSQLHEVQNVLRAAEVRPPPRLRDRDLDMIDELDETNPLGLSLHHGGPYEAVHRVTEAARSRDTWVSGFCLGYMSPSF